jgi:hypothetical protein
MPHTLSPQQAEALEALRALAANLNMDQLTLVQAYLSALSRLTLQDTTHLSAVVETSATAIPHSAVA